MWTFMLLVFVLIFLLMYGCSLLLLKKSLPLIKCSDTLLFVLKSCDMCHIENRFYTSN